jgi:hypothetical protein
VTHRALLCNDTVNYAYLHKFLDVNSDSRINIERPNTDCCKWCSKQSFFFFKQTNCLFGYVWCRMDPAARSVNLLILSYSSSIAWLSMNLDFRRPDLQDLIWDPESAVPARTGQAPPGMFVRHQRCTPGRFQAWPSTISWYESMAALASVLSSPKITSLAGSAGSGSLKPAAERAPGLFGSSAGRGCATYSW